MPDSTALRPHHGTLILIVGIFSLFCTCLPLGIIAWVLGHHQTKEMDAGLVDPTGRSSAQAGKVLGMISVALWVLFALAGIAAVLFWGVTASDVSRAF